MEIMATTTNNHNQKELRLYAPNEQQQHTANATALASGARSPFQREVREWQRIDPDTGALLTGRLEADRWINGPLNKYGKISDSQNISQPNGTQQTQRKQLEVLQTCTATGGAMQVIRSQTVQTTSSRWSTSSASASASPLLLTANNTSNNTSPITTQMQKNKQKTHTSNDYCSSSSITNSTTNANTSPSSFTSPSLLSNGFNQHHHQHLQQHYKQLEQLRQQHNKLQQFPNSFANDFSHSNGSINSRNRNWPDLTQNMSTLDICDNEHDHGNDYIVEQQSTDDDDDGNDGDNNRRRNTRNHNDSLFDNNDHDDDGDDHNHNSDHQYLLTKLNNLKNVDLTKRHSLSVFPNDTANNYDRHDHNHDSHHQHHHHHRYGHNNLSRDSSSGSCSGNNSNTNSGNNHNNNQLFLLDTAPSLKLSNLMKSSSSLSNSSNNSTTASQATTVANTTTTMNTHKTLANNKVSLHAIVGSGSNNHMTTATTTSSTPSPTLTTATQRSSWQQPTLYRQNSNGNATHSHLTKTRVGDNNNGCCSRSGNGGGVCRSSSVSSCDESRSYAANKTETDLRHLQQQQQQQHHIHHVKQNDRLTPTHLPHSYQRVDLESFRHYNNNDTNTNSNNNNNNINNNDTDDDGLRLSNRHLRRQQLPYETNSLQRSRSISTDDLSTEWDVHGGDSEEPAEWRRVSKLRRSFQSTTQKNESYNTSVTNKRPLDLPASSVSVSRIRAELENGRRLNTVMRNNHVDLAALSSILNSNNDKEIKSPLANKRDTFLTAESLKEIRGKLKKLSDESLYKEDFIISQQNNDANPEVEHIVNDQTKVKATYGGRKTPERYQVVTKTEENNNKHTTNSLESRVKYKDTNSVDWHTRRKSYGFEKMSPPEKAMLRMDASTDSGLGRSGELQNWSPTSENSNANRTVVHFGDTGNVNKPSVVQRRYRTQKSYEESENSLEEDTAVAKRHSIAVDESQYVRDNSRQTTQIRLNGFHEPGNYTKFVQSTESTTTTDRGQQKRVEFSKTEVHFATESGRVNIVETDSKPPPTNNFRRRRSRSSSVGPLQSLVKSATTVSTTAANNSTVAMPVTLFGDDSTKKKTLASTTVAYRAPLVGSPEPNKDNGINVTVTIPTHTESYAFHESSRSSYASTSGVDTTDCDTDEMTSLRGILKNKPAKPKPYVLGENIDKPDDLWGVHLKPVNGNQMKTERVYKSESPTLIATTPQKSVAERIQELGSASTQANGFSTKINVSMGSATANANNWEDNGLITSSQRQRATNVQELLMHDLNEHQKMLDEGLKSTTLIIKTLRSANEFDEAMRRLSIASLEGTPAVKPPLMLRSNSYQESSHSLDYKEFAENDVKNIYKSTSFSSTSSWSTIDSTRKCSQDSRKTSTDSGASCVINGSTPRLSFLGNEQIPVSQQLQRLRLIYDAAANRSQDEDSADEEVKSYFKENIDSDSGGGTQDSSSYEDEHCLESSNSWSRLKAKKTIWKIDTDSLSNGGVRSLKKSLDKTDLPKSNVMSIKLHSPQATTAEQPPLKVVPPLAKPRTINLQESAAPKVHTATTVKQAPYKSSLPTKDSLKIVKEARGARQLREHELSYFGVPVSSTSEDEKPKTKYTATTSSFRNSPKRSLPLRKLSEESTTSTLMAMETEKQREQWQLESDKPDLLKHNPIDIKPFERTSLKKKAQLDEEDEHLYENIANDITPVFKVKAATPPLEQYDRKTDLKRDFEILNEMNQNADQTLKELSDEAALKDRRRRSLQRRNSKPLETIDEKSIAERINDSCIAVKISRSTYASEARKSSRHSTPSPSDAKRISSRERSSSQSSVECCPRARSRSLSSEKEYDVTKSKTARTTHMVKHKTVKPTQSRSSSLDSQRSSHSQYSSGDEPQPRSSNSFRREDRSRTKTKRTTSSTLSSTREKQREEKTNTRSTTSSRHNHNHGDTKRISSTTPSTTHRERVECKHDNNAGTATTRHHSSSSLGLQRSTAATSSGRRQKDDIRDSQRMKRTSALTSGRTTAERHDKQVPRSLRDDERNSSQRSSSHRLERNDKDKEKDKTSRSSKGHSSRSTSHQHHERTSKPEKYTKETKTKSTALATHETNTTSSKNAPAQQYHHQHPSHHNSKERHERQHRSKRDEEQQQQQAEHVHGLKSAIIKTTTKLRDKSRSKKEKK